MAEERESLAEAFARMGIGPGDMVRADQYHQLPEWYRRKIEAWVADLIAQEQ